MRRFPPVFDEDREKKVKRASSGVFYSWLRMVMMKLVRMVLVETRLLMMIVVPERMMKILRMMNNAILKTR